MVREALTVQKLDALPSREAAALFIARRAEGLTSSEQQLLDAWLMRDEANRRAFESAELAWRSFDDAGDDEIVRAMRSHARAPRRRALPRWWPAAAAAALLLVAVPFMLKGPSLPDSTNSGHLQAAAQFKSANGEIKQLQLVDGTQMTLDASSEALVDFTSQRRHLALHNGRALFAIQPDASRPFVVSAANRSIVAVGTQFDVNIMADGLIVTLLEGRVDISSMDSGRALVTLRPGQQYIERSGDATIRDIGAATENVTAWRNGFIHFDDQPLAEAADIMNRYTTDQIVIDGKEVSSIRVSGQFRAGDTQRFAATLAEMHRLRLVSQGNRIELTSEK